MLKLLCLLKIPVLLEYSRLLDFMLKIIILFTWLSSPLWTFVNTVSCYVAQPDLKAYCNPPVSPFWGGGLDHRHETPHF